MAKLGIKPKSTRSFSPAPSDSRSFAPSKRASSKRADASLPSWVRCWFILASILVGLDCLYVLGTEYKHTQFVPQVILHLWGWYGESDIQ
jgi:hypothetical protein